MKYTESLLVFVEAWEGFKPFPSPDLIGKAGTRDIGYGHVIKPGEHFTFIDQLTAETILRNDLDAVAVGVNKLVKVPLAQHEFDALCSFAYNLGLDIDEDEIPEGLGDSTLLKHVNAAMMDRAALQFTLWVYSGGKKRKGLVRRRVAEQAMFCQANYEGRP